MFPVELVANAWDKGPGGVRGDVASDAAYWGALTAVPAAAPTLLPEKPADRALWNQPRVGWGVVLPDNPAVSERDRAIGADAPEPIRKLLEFRENSRIFRYVDDSAFGTSQLRRYYVDGPARDFTFSQTQYGTGDREVPYYLLICGSPAQIPWDLQYALNARFAVGRLDLDTDALARYVEALIHEWPNANVNPKSTVVWATDHNPNDISALMKKFIASKFFDRMDSDVKDNSVFVGKAGAGTATGEALLEALQMRPGLLVTTSHGAGGSLDTDPDLKSFVGTPIDDNGAIVSAVDLAAWNCGGAIWYSHACCSAGVSEESVFEGLFEPKSPLAVMLDSLTKLKSITAHTARTLLSAPVPLRAFIGHVEPTFDWTLQNTATRQPLTDSLLGALWDGLYQPWPVGHAFAGHYAPLGSLFVDQATLRRKFDHGDDVDQQLLECQLTARDRMSLVILGDPTVAIPLDR